MQRSSVFFLKYLGVLVLQLAGFGVMSQQDIGLTEKFKAYGDKAIQEKLYLHTDKEIYVSGEIVWFRIYYMDGASHLPIGMSKLAYAEIINANNEPVLQAKIALEPGGGQGSFYLPASLPTGYYSIRTYTNWMKNFGAEYFFEKKITLINTLKSPETFPASDSLRIGVDFFPEGGNMVGGIPTTIGFKGTSNKGTVANFHGYIVDQDNDTITSFTPFKFGMGHLSFRPEQGHRYKAVINGPDGTVTTRALPEVFPTGYVMNLVEADQQKIRVSVKVKRGPGEPATEQVTLAAHTRQSLKVAEKGFLNDSIVFVIDKSRLSAGVTYFTVFNGNGKPVCERLFFIAPAKQIDIGVQPDKSSYGSRQKINLSLTSPSTSPLDMSVSVFSADKFQVGEQATINEYVWLTSELPGDIESPAFYFSNAPGVKEATDNLMLTQGWRKFKWDNIRQPDMSFIKFLPEINGHIISGIMRDTRNEKPVDSVIALLSIAGRPFGFYSSESDKNGMVYFEVKDYYGNAQVVAQSGFDTDSLLRVDILKPFAETVPGKKYEPYVLTEEAKDILLKKSIGMQVQNIYTGDSLRNFIEPWQTDTLPFYGVPAMTYKLDDYVRFTTMEEVLREYVREVGVGLRDEKLNFKMFNPIAREYYYGNTLVMMDGVPLPNPNKIFNYDPLKVKKLDVVTDRYVLGRASFNGIANFTTYNGGFSAFELAPELIAIDYSGLQLQREFYSPAYATKEQLETRIPDFRSTLFWKPNLHANDKGNASVQFYSSDLAGKYIIVVQGMNAKGEFVYGNSEFEVK